MPEGLDPAREFEPPIELVLEGTESVAKVGNGNVAPSTNGLSFPIDMVTPEMVAVAPRVSV